MFALRAAENWMNLQMPLDAVGMNLVDNHVAKSVKGNYLEMFFLVNTCKWISACVHDKHS